MTGVAREGLSTGRFDSDRGDLSCNSVPKVESPGGGVLTVSRVRAARDNLRYSRSPVGGRTVSGVKSRMG